MILLVIILSAIVQYIRLSIALAANKTEGSMSMLLMLVISALNVLYLLYFIMLQTYVLLLEMIICMIAFAFLGVEVILGLVMFIRFKSLEKEA